MGSRWFVERREAVYPIEGLRRLVRSFLRFDRLEDSLVALTIVVTRLVDGVEEWLTEGPALEAVLASAALPAIFPAVQREGSGYIDGGVVDNTPLSVALAAGVRRIYVLLCGGVNSRPIDFGRPYEALLVAFGLSIRTRLRRNLATVPDDVEVVVLEQSGVEEILWQDFSHTEELLELGYLDARRARPCREADRRTRRDTLGHEVVVAGERTAAACEKKASCGRHFLTR